VTAIAVLVLAAACGSKSPTRPTPPPPLPDAPSLTCGANLKLPSLDGKALVVTYKTPAAEGGQTPVTVACLPESGSRFQIGPTEVICTATDALARTATCGFQVVVTAPAKISLTKFLAFGDSITAGEVSISTHLVVRPSKSYPTVLQKMLAARYTAQTITVVNDGRSGETALEGTMRISRAFAEYRPQVLLLLQGVLDLNGTPERVQQVIDSIKFDIRDAQRNGVKRIYVATLLPQRRDGFRANVPDEIESTNDEIKYLASKENVPVVDLYAALVNELYTMIGDDGLHPTVAGYQRIAETFFARLEADLEVAPSLAAQRP
jgi:lysophospholipase L1-like esterase